MMLHLHWDSFGVCVCVSVVLRYLHSDSPSFGHGLVHPDEGNIVVQVVHRTLWGGGGGDEPQKREAKKESYKNVNLSKYHYLAVINKLHKEASLNLSCELHTSDRPIFF